MPLSLSPTSYECPSCHRLGVERHGKQGIFRLEEEARMLAHERIWYMHTGTSRVSLRPEWKERLREGEGPILEETCQLSASKCQGCQRPGEKWESSRRGHAHPNGGDSGLHLTEAGDGLQI